MCEHYLTQGASSSPFAFKFVLERERKGERKKKHRFVIPLIDAFIG